MTFMALLASGLGAGFGYMDAKESLKENPVVLRDASRPLYRTTALGEDIGSTLHAMMIGGGVFAAAVSLNKAMGGGFSVPDVRIYVAGFGGLALGRILFRRQLESEGSK